MWRAHFCFLYSGRCVRLKYGIVRFTLYLIVIRSIVAVAIFAHGMRSIAIDPLWSSGLYGIHNLRTNRNNLCVGITSGDKDLPFNLWNLILINTHLLKPS